MMLWIAVAGGCGASLRFLLDSYLSTRSQWRIPIGTLVINVLGSFILGLLVGHYGHASHTAAVIGTGMMGGFTTFSAASVESARLLLDPRSTHAGRISGVVHALVMLLASVGAAALGLWLGGV